MSSSSDRDIIKLEMSRKSFKKTVALGGLLLSGLSGSLVYKLPLISQLEFCMDLICQVCPIDQVMLLRSVTKDWLAGTFYRFLPKSIIFSDFSDYFC